MPRGATAPGSARTTVFAAVLLVTLAPTTLSGTAAFAVDLPAPLKDSDFLFDGGPDREMVELGRLLFFDPILSGNRNISCGTCHDPGLGTGDAVALSIGEGGSGQGTRRRSRDGVTGRIPRNAQALFNIGAREYSAMFHDGRLEPDPQGTFESGFWSPAREQLPAGLDSLLAAQAMFPVTSAVEMAGHKGENPVGTAVAEDRLAGRGGAWDLLAERLRRIPGYVTRFIAVFDEVHSAGDIAFTHAARALAAFQSKAFRSQSSPFDHALKTGQLSMMTARARAGMKLFYGKAGCANCHSGPLLTDHRFHAIAMPQIGPGKGHGSDTGYWRASGFADRLEDEGRYRVTFETADLFRFRTPSLRNVALTGPWGHAGAYQSLEAVIRHHLDPLAMLENYDPQSAALPRLEPVIEQTGRGSQLIFRALNPARRDDFDQRDGWVQRSDRLRGRIAAANSLEPRSLSDSEVASLVAFLEALTDPAARELTHLIPDEVPSGLVPQPRRRPTPDPALLQEGDEP